jgi:hypothetical protein
MIERRDKRLAISLEHCTRKNRTSPEEYNILLFDKRVSERGYVPNLDNYLEISLS